ncbi:MAG: 3'-5' exoribonuclease, partial [Pseudonocardiales bacterium]|nr:3'-5' exoribonuclease [Pseudonocardiales bacterium]
MRFFYDCEFIEDGLTIDLVSIGVVDEDGREFYA